MTLLMEDEDALIGEQGDPVENPHEGIWDARKLGRVIKGARMRAGYDRVADLVLDVERVTGVRRHENTLYDIQKGKRLPDLELLTALIITLKIPHEEIASAVRPEFRDRYDGMF